MLKQLSVLTLAMTLTAAPCALATAQSEPATAEKHCLWRVRSESTTMHLLGSIHLLKPAAFPLAPVIERAYKDASVTVFEVDLGADGTPEASLGMLAAGLLPEGTTLQEVVSPETYRLTERRIEEAGLDPGRMQRVRPWMVATTLALTELQRAGYSATDGVDRHYYQRAKTEGKSVVGLETIQFQLDLFADLSPREDEAFLRQTVRELETVIPMVDELIGHWQAGRTGEVEALLAEGYREHPDLFKKLVSDRNLDWIPKLEELLAGDERVFVVVGALHLIGEGGVIGLLEEKGYTVEQL